MDKSLFLKTVNTVKVATKKHSPEILTGIGIAGMITTTIMAVKATPKALDIMAEIKESHSENTDRKAFAKDIVTKVAPVYVPATVIGLWSVACLIGASSVNFKRNAALATAYSLSESALREYQEKVVETIGEKKERVVRDSVAKEKIEKDPVENKTVIITGKGDTLCYDILSGRYFKSDVDKLKKAENELNRQMIQDSYVSLNDFYYEIGLDGIKIGNFIGWNVDRGFIELDFSSQLTNDSEPCLVIDYRIAPKYDYDR